ncbi:thioesterase domain-containing protein [Rhizobium sp. 9140]|uniref:thioesterase domain-containing protein n=1 Tax=Rhizobium sp. 9140 TaxID=1761900 RepID=UPI00079C3DED|nr:thioesterase domain-containing protein [Rhizobium sp. 9140]CZT34419.1 Thioesterase domain-containing protein [Rhizobium sp. 9140]
MLATLTGLCQQTMRIPIAADDDLVAQGLNANRALALIKLFWVRTGIELDVNIFYIHRTPRAIVEAVEQGKLHSQILPADKILPLRDGNLTRPLFLFAGGVNCFLETQGLLDAMTFDGVIYGITLTDFGRPADNPPKVEDEVELSYRAMKDIQPQGPYRLAGYSFGGVLALELARRARAEGDMIEVLLLLDPPQNDHSWPLGLWAGLMRRIVARQMKSVLGKLTGRAANRGKPSAERTCDAGVEALREGRAASAFRHSPPRRGHQFFFRFRNPRLAGYPLCAPQWAGGYVPAYDARARQLLQMKGLYRPRVYDGPLVFFGSKSGSPIDCDATLIWKAYLPRADWISASGNHLSMIVARNGRRLAVKIDLLLQAGPASVREPSSSESVAA